MELGNYELHLNSGCSYLPIESAIEGILLQPESAPLSSIESALQANLVRRSLSMSPDKDVMVFKSVGKVCCCKTRDKATQTKLTYEVAGTFVSTALLVPDVYDNVIQREKTL